MPPAAATGWSTGTTGRLVLGRIAPMIRTGGVLFYSVVGHPRRSRSALGRVREWFGAPPRDYAITASDLAGKLGQQGFRVREVRGLGHASGYRAAAGPISYMGYAFRLSDRPRMPRAERRLQPGCDPSATAAGPSECNTHPSA